MMSLNTSAWSLRSGDLVMLLVTMVEVPLEKTTGWMSGVVRSFSHVLVTSGKMLRES